MIICEFLSHEFFREINWFAKELFIVNWFHEKFEMGVKFWNSYTLSMHIVEITEIYSHYILAKILWNQRVY